MSSHTLKCKPDPYRALRSGGKTGEIRRCDDRDFKVGQTVEIKEIDHDGVPTGEKMYRLITHVQTGYGLPECYCILSYAKATPSAAWRVEGKPDPHAGKYDCQRSNLAKGDLTDDQLANGLFLCDHRNSLDSIGWLTAAKDRIRWLSRKLEEAHADAEKA